jgi:hypothetical protein
MGIDLAEPGSEYEITWTCREEIGCARYRIEAVRRIQWWPEHTVEIHDEVELGNAEAQAVGLL